MILRFINHSARMAVRIRPDSVSAHSRRTDRGLAGGANFALVLAVLVAVWVAWTLRDACMDDAFIGFRYVHNLVHRGELTFNPGERIEGVTNIGWLLVIAPLAAISSPVVAAKTLGVVLVLVTLIGVRMVCGRLCRGRAVVWTAGPVLLLTATHPDFMLFANNGMETALLAAIVVALSLVGNGWTLHPAIAAIAGLATLVHPECVLIYPIVVAVTWMRDASARVRVWVALTTFVFVLAMITSARWWYFGDLLPNTFYAKSSSAGLFIAQGARWLGGVNVNIPFPFAGWLVVPVFALGFVRAWRANADVATWLGASSIVGLVFAVYSAPDWTGLGRYFAPYVPAVFVLLWLGVIESSRLIAAYVNAPRVARVCAAAAILTLLGLNVARMTSLTSAEYRGRYPGYVVFAEGLTEPARALFAFVGTHDTIATRRIGAAGYCSDRRIFDYAFGLIDRDVAAAIRKNGAGFHLPSNSALAARWRAAEPDWILEDRSVIDEIALAAGGSRERFVVHGLAYGVDREFPIASDGGCWTLCRRLP